MAVASAASPTVSVIIPVYNHAHVIERAIRSVLRQSFDDYELLIVNDGSTDDLSTTLHRFEGHGIRTWQHERTMGVAAARNTGVMWARAPIVAFLDADDEWMPDKLKEQIALLRNAPPDTLACCSDYVLHNAGAAVVEQRTVGPRSLSLEDLLFGCVCSPGSTLIVRTDCFAEIGLFDARFKRLEDWDWLLRYTKKNYKIGIVNKRLAIIHETSSPDFEATMDSIEMFSVKHASLDSTGHWIHFVKLNSSILIEKAAAYYRRRRIFKACLFVLAALAVYPARNAVFFKNIIIKFFDGLGVVSVTRRRQPDGSTTVATKQQ